MPNNWFQFKQFIIRQEHTGMKVGTDGVLLGAWAEIEDRGRRTADGEAREEVLMLDVGTGTGLLALMLAQRFPGAFIDAIEIEASSFRQACQNVGLSPWPDRINVIGADFLEWTPGRLYDLIICNPPFFSHSLRAPGRARSVARHDDLLPFGRFIGKSAGLLNPAGSLALVIPAGRLDESVAVAAGSGLSLTRILRVRGTPRSVVKRVLIQFGRQRKVVETDELIIRQEAGGALSEPCRQLTKPFYL
ncbi:MAG: methyltransferase [Bacteroidales bacterium]